MQGLLKQTPDDLKTQDTLALADEHLADIHEQRGEMQAWRRLRKEATSLRWQIANQHPEMPAYRAAALWNEAYNLSGENRPVEAATAYERALAANLEAIGADPGNAALRRTSARIQRNLAHCYHESGHSQQALAHYQAALRLDTGRMADAPSDTRVKLETSWDYAEIGWIQHERHRDRDAEESFSLALALQESLAAADPGNSLARLEIGKLKVTAAPACEAAGHPRRAAQYLVDATRVFAEAVALDPSNDDARFHLGWAWSNLGDTYLRAAGGAVSGWSKASECFARAAEALGHLKRGAMPDLELKPEVLLAHVARRVEESRGHKN